MAICWYNPILVLTERQELMLLTNEGKGLVHSNNSATLRTAFTSGTFTLFLEVGSSADIIFCIAKFTGNNNNVRVSIVQFASGTGASSNRGQVVFNPHLVSSTDGVCGRAAV